MAGFRFKLSNAALPFAAETDNEVTTPDPGTPLSKGESMGGPGLSCWLPYEFSVIITNGLVAAPGESLGPFLGSGF